MTSPSHLTIKEYGKRELVVTLIVYMHDVVDLHWFIREGRNKVHAEALISGVSAKARWMVSMIMREARANGPWRIERHG
jgi:hypothetical protein